MSSPITGTSYVRPATKAPHGVDRAAALGVEAPVEETLGGSLAWDVKEGRKVCAAIQSMQHP